MRLQPPPGRARHPLRRLVSTRAPFQWATRQTGLRPGDLRDFLLAYAAGLIAFGTFLA